MPSGGPSSFEQVMGVPRERLGADMDSVVDRYRLTRSVEVAGAERPSNLLYRYNGVTSFWHPYALMDWYCSEVSGLSTIRVRVPSEIMRYGIGWVPNFSRKCMDCGYESETRIDICPKCGSARLRVPDPAQKDYFVRPDGKSFLDEANDNHQPLEDVVFQYIESEVLNNQAYMLCVTGDIIDSETAELIRGYPLEFLFQDPKFVKFLYDDTGKPGTRYGFVRRDRQTVMDLETDPDAAAGLTDDGDVIYPAEWQIGQNYGGTGQSWFYTGEEVYQDKWFRPSLIYGMPIWLDMEDDLLTYHYAEKMTYKIYQNGYCRKMIILPGFDDESAEAITQGVQSILAQNNFSIPMIATPPPMPGTPELRAQVLDLGAEDIDQLLKVKDEVRHRMCAHASMPDIFAGDVEGSGGMNNESQQITIFDRFLTRMYNKVDRLLGFFVSWFPRITDWSLVVNRPGKAHTEHRKRMDDLEFLLKLKQAGFDVFYEDGELRYSPEPMDQVQRRKEEEAMKQQQAMQAMMPPMPPGPPGPPEGEDPDREHGGPDKGTARRDDPEIGAAAEEVDEARDEAGSAMGGM